ncbi:peroxidase family protein [Paeniroseomonas aquatica]|uniref:Peroxidase family protein n=1 Tax=Paeniroseomonas aquatica TaxID=373043 RepID=A0ABT8A5M4_9PROT|nr:peroxidase family protein [Paeniroseomonas aquatica]MDN3564706.1 peroxidase family protein [Paeniroseomonas aquatica]
MEYRSIDGSGNDPGNPLTNVTNTAFLRLAPEYFADDQRGLVDGPNPRSISNVVVGEGAADIENPQGLSGMMYAWGQFIDHDINLTADSRTGQPISIVIPKGDPVFADGTIIPMSRADVDANGDPVNAVTGWIDGSMVYGSTEATAARLRAPDGHMLMSEGRNLPVGPVDPTGEDAAQSGGLLGHIAGDGRADENPSLTALQTLFVREHNWQVDRLYAGNPCLDGDTVFNMARAIVTAEIQNITYQEFLPHLLGDLAPGEYRGFDDAVDPRMAIEFAGAAYRFGHSTVSPRTEKLDEYGHPAGEISLRETFFLTPAEFAADGGADGLLRHLASDLSQAMDARIVEDLRNFLFDPPVGLDLAAINIQRGRDLGLPHLNEMREALHLDPYTAFCQITDDQGTVAALEQAFGSVDAVDLWTGGLAERVMPGAFVGETFGLIIADQFERSRDGDRLWFENQGFDAETLQQIRHSGLSDIILRNTDTQHIQDDVFTFAERRAEGSEAMDPELPQLVIPLPADTVLA